ncbi:MAG: putative nitrogen fixation protein NifT [Calditerrivibrio sp.]|nr:putative nitrogen fixation protein NifT [Calditerrivibrio sp.]
MKVTINKKSDGLYAYVAKKDLESKIVDIKQDGAFGGVFTLENGWKLYIEPQDELPKLPKTFDAKKLE